MRLDVKARVRVVYVTVFAMGVLLAVLVFAHGDKVLEVSRQLVHADLAQLKDITALKEKTVQIQSLLYKYAATRNREEFLQTYPADKDQLEARLRTLSALTNSAPIVRAREQYQRIDATAKELDLVLNATPIDRVRVAQLLNTVDTVTRLGNADLDVLVESIEAQARDKTTMTEVNVQRMNRVVILFSIGFFVVAMLIRYYINAYIHESAERRLLADFPERNPNPIMRITLDGQVAYSNPAAADLLAALGVSAHSSQSLLPPDYKARLEALCRSGKNDEVWEHEIGGRTLKCEIHFVSDLAIFHAYVLDITEHRRTEEKLVHQAYHNALTGLPNRRMFQEFIPDLLGSSERHKKQAVVFLLSLDRFENVIESFGHDIGDRLLKAVAVRLKTVLEELRDVHVSLTLYHFEGTLFTIFMPDLAPSQSPIVAAEKLAKNMGPQLYIAGREFYVSFSIGISVFPHDGEDVVTLLKNADTAMQRVKKESGHGFQLYKPEMNAMAAEWLSLENYLRHALEHNELRLHYQPRVDILSGRTVGFEALLRWEHSERGMLFPVEFIKLAEETGLIVPIGEWVLRTACAQNRDWRNQGLVDAVVAVNISAYQFHQQNLPQLVAEVLSETGLAPEGLELEITESVAMHDVTHTISILQDLKKMNVKLSIDDFGAGFSSMNYLKRFPIDILKIDQSFVQNITTDESDAAITRTIITLGHALKIKVVAEGVETKEQLAYLRQYECDEAQGNLYSQPVPADEFVELLHKERRAASR